MSRGIRDACYLIIYIYIYIYIFENNNLKVQYKYKNYIDNLLLDFRRTRKKNLHCNISRAKNHKRLGLADPTKNK
jgi:hypothetical protein